MSEKPAKPVLLTGASGALGRVLTRSLSAEGWTLRLTDIAPFSDPVPTGASFTAADLNDGVTIARLAEGCGAIVHLGGVSVERPFEEVLGPNIRVLSVSPGAVDTGFVPGRTTEMVERAAQRTPLKRVVQADEVAQTVMAAVTLMTATTGSILLVEGGTLL